MLRRSLFVFACLLLPMSAALADSLYVVNVDTSTLAATHGGIDFSFFQGPLNPVDPASVSILLFTTDGTLGSASTTPGVTGTLPGTVTIDNGESLTEYFSDVWFGATMRFFLEFSGPAVNSPSGFAGSGSTFVFSIFSDPDGTIPVLTTDSMNGYAVTVDLSPNGASTLTNYSNETTADLVPEPATLPLAAASLILLCLGLRRRARAGIRAL